MTIALELDRQEQSLWGAEDAGIPMSERGQNISDDGNFSIQVLIEALKAFNVSLIPSTSSDDVAKLARRDPTRAQGYICNLLNHWLCIRKIGRHWWNLNSLLPTPELVTETYLSLYLEQLRQEGYSIFLVVGPLPRCELEEAEEAGQVADPTKSWASIARKSAATGSSSSNNNKRKAANEDDDLEAAIAQSLVNMQGHGEDNDLAAAIAASLQDSVPASESDDDENDDDFNRAMAMSTGLQPPSVPKQLQPVALEQQKLTPEPPEDTPNCSLILFRLPDGSRVQRRFLNECTLADLYGFIASLGHTKIRICTSHPRLVYSRDEEGTIQDLKLSPKAMLIVEKAE
eukprot:CAMPEP_0184662454 /NCGR_PEP_ID=MMETSP0308-20130426/43274_1 /TAXON_ID=38269 /ORGANISM="Gloeochaete witrockiana, Strain SAG 46.84" /LENGTH=343 /DNA_ID=CAMNT_0027104483 /DNA_START=201 /DNA_END=1232 /DNA_ORIENTATION=-